MWNQVYNPFGNTTLSTLAAAIPVVSLLLMIASGRVKVHIAAITALVLANLVAIFLFTMPANLSIRASLLGIVSGFFPIGWIVLNVIFMYRLTVATGRFDTLQQAIGGVSADRRIQLLLIAFAFGAFFEGASGFGMYASGEFGRQWLGTSDAFYGTGAGTVFANGIPYASYNTWNIGIGFTYKVFTLDLRYSDTDLSKGDCNAFTSAFNATGTTNVTAINPGGAGSNWCGSAGIAKLSVDLTAMTNLK